MRQVGDVRGEATTLNNIGRVYDALGEKKKALEFYDKALLLHRQVGDASGEAATLNNIGMVYDALGEKKKALEFLDKVLPLMRGVGDASGEATTLSNIGKVYNDLGENKKALEYLEKALSLCRQVGDVSGEATTLNNIGYAYNALGEKKKALEFYDKALPLSRQVGDINAEGVTLDNMAGLLRDTGRPGEAVAHYRGAAACYQRRNPPNVQEAAGSLKLAFNLALQHRLWSEGHAIMADLSKLGLPEASQALFTSRFLGQSGSAEATAAYQRLLRLAPDLPPEQKQVLERAARAGLRRIQHRAAFGSCPGVVVTQVVAGSAAAKLGLREDDILLRYQGACIHEVSDLRAATDRSAGQPQVMLEVLRDSGTQRLTPPGGRLGVAVSPF